MLPGELSAGTPSAPNGPKRPKYSSLETFLEFQAGLVADLVHARNFHDTSTWNRCVASYMALWVGESQSAAFAEDVLAHYLAIDQVNSLDLHFFSISHLSPRLNILLLKTTTKQKASSYAIRSFHWHTERSCFSPTPPFV